VTDPSDPTGPDGVPRRRLLQGATGLVAALAGCGASGRHGSAERVTVASATDLHDAFEALSPGDVLYVSPENAPYRTRGWLDVDVSDVTILGPGLPGLLLPVDGADFGGVRIGHRHACENVLVAGLGFDGNRGRASGAPRRHGIAVHDATNVTLAGNHVRRTGPLRHGDGGSGISVTRAATGVRVVGNVVEDWGDRGVQFAGTRLLATGNHLVGGLDRAISCDLWYPHGADHTARHVLVSGNLLGEVREGSLTGVAHNAPVDERHGNVGIVGNVGYGAHKSFCHVRGPEPVRNVTVQSNTSTQATEGLETERTTRYAGVAIDPAGGRNLAVRNNEFYGYSGHGVNVDGAVRDVTVQGNTLSRPGLTGVRVRHARHVQVTGNRIVEPGASGVSLEDAAEVAVADNHVRGAAGVGIDVVGDGDVDHDVLDNVVAGAGHEGGAPTVRVRARGVRVRGNAVRRHAGPAIREGPAAGGNLYEANHAEGEAPWVVTAPDSRTRDNTPPVDVHRGLTADADGRVTVRFDRPYARPPRLTFGRRPGPVGETTHLTDADGNVVGAEVAVGGDGPVDVFVDDA
jgi:hypothetical protein